MQGVWQGLRWPLETTSSLSPLRMVKVCRDMSTSQDGIGAIIEGHQGWHLAILVDQPMGGGQQRWEALQGVPGMLLC